MLEVRGVKKSFGKNAVLKGVDLSVAKGDVVAIIGASGSGKTTLLRCLNFLERADEGTLSIGGDEVNFKSVNKKEIHRLRGKTAMVFQNYCLFNNKTVLQNVTEGLIVVRKIPKQQAIEKATELLVKVGLSDKLDSYPSSLSGGQQQRVGIARAMAQSPDVILLDEPTSALDPELVGETLAVIRNVAKEGITMIIVTHEMLFAYDIANKVVFIDEGLVVEQGTPTEVLISPKEERTQRFISRFNLSSNYSI
ncbi:MAG: amino acid ABC transporter ATP-binding protein [Oscillospiraceae bacterium]|jgi:L-cystine transport system ATP-binding protein|nr:amino acid ABC transporter ATP-binding protein [Oscillospiraceae bacterium]